VLLSNINLGRTEADALLLIYDGDCRFCRFGIELLRRLDAREAFAFCPFGHPVAESRLAALPADERYDSFHVASSDGRLYSGTHAAREALRALPGGSLAIAFGLHNIYPLLARYRWLLGRLAPDGDRLITCG
jgi:predicted DCC family thiol-disulfide oxidoreductase YuxK